MTRLSSAQLDRAVGVLLGSAAGDALGAPYEFHPPRAAAESIAMIGGGTFGWERGEWTDDTSMGLVLAQVAASGADLAGDDAQDRIANAWYRWAQKAPDVGAQTRSVLNSAYHAAREALTPLRASHLRIAADEHHKQSGRSGGNGSLMRTAVVALAYLHDEDKLFEVAQSLSHLTHHDDEAAEACALWCLAVRHAVLCGSLNIRRGLSRLSTTRREVWLARIEAAEITLPADFEENGWVVEAFQAAWSAISHTGVPMENPSERTFRVQHLARAIELAARSGNDTDTIAAIAGGLVGAAYGGSAVPAEWRRLLHGWPGLRERDLTRLAVLITRDGDDSPEHWPNRPHLQYPGPAAAEAISAHPYDDDLLIGGFDALHHLPFGVEAIVSLCRVGREDIPELIAPEDHVEMWIVESDARVENPNLAFVLDDAARVITQLRSEGKRVYLHGIGAGGVACEVAARYGADRRDVTPAEALTAVLESVSHSAAGSIALR
ncbi:ADP-ribosylglycohydrolase [Jatrophihabitans sp. GAS493]|uniref:ADP-ribosylglycohydrolase family protein n=1 Tax=Jatrophihabitans sp. GAS493 TaxID=1907575 RepID=UPI000BBFCB4A|nr:ADP-ribosylglycohydrolase family protein [Jatrophihabitans sp. GAS493]SOD70848.1 ADP-ribosylglycohydrolase [Jatrophihabitans sp. GAS493]